MTPGVKATAEQKEKFVAHLAATDNVTEASQVAGFSRICAYDHRKNDPEFAKAWDSARAAFADLFEQKCIEKANGYLVDVRHKGIVVGQEMRYSPMLAALILKAKKKSEYATRTELTGLDGTPLIVSASEVQAMSDAELAQQLQQELSADEQ